MRATVAAIIAALTLTATLALVGCGPSPTDTAANTASTASNAAQTAVPPSSSGASGTAAASVSATANTAPHPFPTITTPNQAPAEVNAALKARQPFMLVFVDSRQNVTADQAAVIALLSKKYRGLMDFFTYDLATYYKAPKDSEAYKNAESAILLAQKLGTGYMPAIVVVNKDGLIIWQSTGYQDEGTLEKQVMRATQ